MLGLLVDDGRMSVNEVANRAGISRATAYARYDRLLAGGAIRGFRADVDPGAIGLDIAAMILINIKQGSWPTMREQISRLPGVEYVAALRDVVLHRLQGMPEGRSTHTIFVLDEQRHPIGSAHHLGLESGPRRLPR